VGLKDNFALKTVIGNTDLELTADPGESFLIKNVLIYNPASDYVTFKIDKTTVGYFRVGGVLGSHLPFLQGKSAPLISAHAGSAIADHTNHGHKSLTVMATDAAADKTDFVSISEGDGTAQATVFIGNVGSLGADIDIASSDEAVSAHSVTQPSNHTLATVPMQGMKTILAWMIENGWMEGYPVAVGETFRLSGVKQANSIQLVIYEIYDAGDMDPAAPNGSQSKEYIFLNYGNSGGTIATIGDHLLDTPVNPAEFIDFPFGKSVPAKTSMEILCVLASDFAPSQNDGTDDIYTQYLKFIADRVTLFDDDRNDLLFLGPSGVNVGSRDRVGEGWSLIGNYSNVDMRLPFVFPESLVYTSGDDLDLYVTFTGQGTYQNVTIDEHEIALIEKVIRSD